MHIWKESHADRLHSRSLRDHVFLLPTPEDNHDDEEFSEPENGEDAYLPLTRELLCMKVVNALVNMQRASIQMRLKYAVPGDSPLYDGKIRPPSPGEIANWLARNEEWRQVGELPVVDALRHLHEMDVVYKVVHGRWQIQAEYLRHQNISRI
jgi:hypothetical protein